MGQVLLNVPYETSVSDPPEYAGARVIRMIERSLGGNPPDVQQVYQHATALNAGGENWPGWYIDPQGMNETLIDFDPRGSRHFVIYANTVLANADNQVRWTIDNYQVAEGNLVNGGTHWVCVIGYTTDSSGKTNGFIINDPAYEGGGAGLVVAKADWDSAYTPVTGGVQWLNQIVEVGDPRPATKEYETAPRRIVMPGDRLITPDEAVKLAVDGVRTQFGDVQHLRRVIEAGRPGKPRLVARLDVPGRYYYVVPLQAGGSDDGQAIGAISVDARFGDVLSASGAEKPFALWPVREEQVRDLVTRQPIPVYEPPDSVAARLFDTFGPMRGPRAEMAGTAYQVRTSRRDMATAAIAAAREPVAHVMLRPGEFEIAPQWVWDPCWGTSPFYPAYQIRTPWNVFYANARSGLLLPTYKLWCWPRLGA